MKKQRIGALSNKTLGILRTKIHLGPAEARRAMKAGFKVGLVTHRPIGGEKAYLMYYMRPADFRRWKLGE